MGKFRDKLLEEEEITPPTEEEEILAKIKEAQAKKNTFNEEVHKEILKDLQQKQKQEKKWE